MSKKIVIIHPAFWKQAMGGAEIQIKYLVEFLLQENIDVHYIFEDKNIKYDTSYHPNLKLHPLKKIKLSKRFGNRWFLYENRINSLLNEIKPDAIYTRFSSSWSGIAAQYAKKNNISHVWAIASDNDLKSKSFDIAKPLNIFENRLVRKAFLNATHIIVQNKWQEKELFKLHNRDGVYLKQAAPILQNVEIKKDYTKLSLVWIANMKSLKRPEIFIELAQYFKNSTGISLKMIGRLDKSYLHLIEAEDQNSNFDYVGELSNEEVNEHLLQTDVLINTSEYEGFSNTFIQAWMRKNIVISMNSNPDEILTNYNIGFICPTIEEMKEKINFLLENRTVLNEMQETAVNYVNKEHNLDENLKTITKLLKITENGTTLV